MTISVRTNALQVARRMGQRGSKQIPFATKNAVNDTLFDVRSHLINRTFPAAFASAPNKQFIKQALRVDKAKDKHAPTGSVHDRFEYDWMERQARGGRKTPMTSRSLAVPHYGPGLKRTKRGPSQKRRPAELLKNRRKYFSGKPKGFPSAAPGVWQRMGAGGRKKIRMVYAYTTSAKVRKEFKGYEDAAHVVKREFEGHMRKNLAKALRSKR